MATLLVVDTFDVLGIEIKLAIGLKAAFIPACTGTVLESLFSGDNPSAQLNITYESLTLLTRMH